MGRDGERDEDAASRKRAPYEPPAILWEEQLSERPGLVMACAKIDPSLGGGCEAGTGSS